MRSSVIVLIINIVVVTFISGCCCWEDDWERGDWKLNEAIFSPGQGILLSAKAMITDTLYAMCSARNHSLMHSLNIEYCNEEGKSTECFAVLDSIQSVQPRAGNVFIPLRQISCSAGIKYNFNMQLSTMGASSAYSIAGSALCHQPTNCLGDCSSLSGTDFSEYNGNRHHLMYPDLQDVVDSTTEASNVIDLFNEIRIDGFRNFGPYSSGVIVSALGDINADGYDDILVGQRIKTPANSVAFIIYGQDSIVWDNYLNELNITQGFPVISLTIDDTIAATGAGDINGDGFNDFLVGTDLSADNTTAQIYVLFGHRYISTVNLTDPTSYEGVTISYHGDFCGFGSVMTALKDINGDGYDDIMIGASAYNNYQGAAFVIYGKADFTAFTINASVGLSPNDGFMLIGEVPGDEFGASMGPAGDIDNDGYKDIIIGARNWSERIGRAYVVYGGSNLNFSSLSMSSLGSNGFMLTGVVDGDSAGWAAIGVGDLNNDGIADFAVSSPNARLATGYATVVYGQSARTSFPSNIALNKVSGTRGFRLFGDYTLSSFGYAITGVGDMNGDSIDDLAISAPFGYFSRGIVYVIFGAMEGLRETYMISLDPSKGIFYLGTSTGVQGGALGYALAGIGDMDRDGVNDLLCGAPDLSSTAVILGNPAGLQSTDLTDWNTNIDAFTGANPNDFSGYTVSQAGDVNSDGFDDVLIGALIASPLGRNAAGMFYIIYGGEQVASANLRAITASKGSIFYGPSASAICSRGLETGDINGDGYPDILASCSGSGITYVIYGKGTNYPLETDLADWEPSWGLQIIGTAADNCGYSLVSSDYNGDGFDDILIGCYSADPDGVTDAGIVYIIWGGTNATTITLASITPSMGIVIKGTFQKSRLGCCKYGRVGDVNGDGIDDILISSPDYYDSRGVAYLIYGSRNLPSTINLSDWDIGSNDNPLGITLVGFQPNDQVGYALSGGGDFNRDGYADLLLGALGVSASAETYVGAAYLVYGGPHMASIDFSNLQLCDGFTMFGSEYGDRVGAAVSSIGDMNNDGYGDLLIGANGYDANRGAAYVVYGRAVKLSSNLALADLSPQDGLIILGAESSDRTGFSVSFAGDIDNNGVDDYLVGAYNAQTEKGMTYLFKSIPATTEHPTSFPTNSPTNLPTPSPNSQSTFEQYEEVILLTAIPTVILSVPIYFSQRICFRILRSWGSVRGTSLSQEHRAWYKRFIYTSCKRFFLSSYLEYIENSQRKHELDQEQLLGGANEAAERGEEESPAVELTRLDVRASGEFVANPMIENSLEEGTHPAPQPISEQKERWSDQSDREEVQEWIGRRTIAAAERSIAAFPTEDTRSSSDGPSDSVIVRAVFEIRYDDPVINALMNGRPTRHQELVPSPLHFPRPLPKDLEEPVLQVGRELSVEVGSRSLGQQPSFISIEWFNWIEWLPLSILLCHQWGFLVGYNPIVTFSMLVLGSGMYIAIAGIKAIRVMNRSKRSSLLVASVAVLGTVSFITRLIFALNLAILEDPLKNSLLIMLTPSACAFVANALCTRWALRHLLSPAMVMLPLTALFLIAIANSSATSVRILLSLVHTAHSLRIAGMWLELACELPMRSSFHGASLMLCQLIRHATTLPFLVAIGSVFLAWEYVSQL